LVEEDIPKEVEKDLNGKAKPMNVNRADDINKLGSVSNMGNAGDIGGMGALGGFGSKGEKQVLGTLDLAFKRIRGRREFFDEVLNYIKKEKEVALIKLEAYFQYTTGASSTSIHPALAVLENVGLIDAEDVDEGTKFEDIIYRPKMIENKGE
jgi:hypothetical protein